MSNDGASRAEKLNYPMRKGVFWLVVGLSLLARGMDVPTCASTVITVTNHAGRVVTGPFGGVTNGTFMVSGRRYPLSILSPDEQLRVKRVAGVDVRTAREKRFDRARDLMLERIRLREAEGEIDKATADRLRREAAGTVP